MLGIDHLAAAELRLAQSQHGRAELLHHSVIPVHPFLELAVDVALKLPGLDAVMGGQPVQCHRPVRRRRVAGGRQSGSRGDGGQPVPVHLAGHREEDLLEQMDARLSRVDLGHAEAGPLRRRGEPFNERSGRQIVGRYHELEGRTAILHVPAQVVAFEKGDVIVDRDHSFRSVNARPA